jgi:AGCS family alanine or glycine:cation symporter
VAAFGIGCMVQANSISSMVDETFRISPWWTGAVMTVLTAVVILGGIRSIASVCERLVPFMAVFYVFGCAVLLVIGFKTLPATVGLIVSSAFTGHAAIGGFLGAGVREAIRYGVARGLFSNESGLGSAPIVAAAAQTTNPVRQALVSSTGTFWDTVVVCAMTGLVLVNSGEWTNGLNGAALTKAAFADFPVVGPLILTVGLLTFVFSTILGWSYYGEKAAEYLFGARAVLPYRVLWVAAVMVGSVVTLKAVWSFADIANGLMACPTSSPCWRYTACSLPKRGSSCGRAASTAGRRGNCRAGRFSDSARAARGPGPDAPAHCPRGGRGSVPEMGPHFA